MSLPNKDVLTSLIESYLSFRASSWGVDLHDPKTAKPNRTGVEKLKICGQFLLDIEAAKTPDDWRKLAHALLEKANAEEAVISSYWLSFMYSRFLPETLRAVASCILFRLKEDEKEFSEAISQLKADVKDEKQAQQRPGLMRQLQNLETPHVAAHFNYFNVITKAWDPRAKELKEQNFVDFETNTLKKHRIINENLVIAAKKAADRPLVAPDVLPGASSKLDVQPEPVAVMSPAADSKQALASVAPPVLDIKPTFAAVLDGSSQSKSSASSLKQKKEEECILQEGSEALPEVPAVSLLRHHSILRPRHPRVAHVQPKSFKFEQ